MTDYWFFWVMMAFCGVVVAITAVYVASGLFDRQAGEVGGWEVRGAGARVGAVVRTTIREGLRVKLVAGFAGLVLASIPIFWFTLKGDGTIKGELQMFVAYCLGFASFVLALLTIVFSCRSLATEIASRQIFGIVAKPIPRWQILAGKYIGVMGLNLLLVAIALAGVFAGVRMKLSRFKDKLHNDLVAYAHLTPAQGHAAIAALDDVKGAGGTGFDSPIIPVMAEALGMTPLQIGDLLLRLPEATRVNLRRYDELRRQVLIARAAVRPEIPDLTARIEEEFKARLERGEISEFASPRQIRDQIRIELQKEYCAVPFGSEKTWTIKGPKPEKGRDFLMSVRFKLVSGGYMNKYDKGGQLLEEDTFLTVWGVGDRSNAPKRPPYLELWQVFPANAFCEWEVPSESVGADGEVILTFYNEDPRRVEAIFEIPTGGLEVLYRVGSFERNLVAAGLSILMVLACLTAFGVCASTFLSWPVGVLIVMTLYILWAVMPFVAESLGTTSDYYDPSNITTELRLRQAAVTALSWVLSLGKIEPANQLVEGRAITGRLLWADFWQCVLAKGQLVMGIAVLIFRRRELASVVV